MVPRARFELAKARLLRPVGVPISIATWAIGAPCKDSNPRPPIYRNGALPTELTERERLRRGPWPPVIPRLGRLRATFRFRLRYSLIRRFSGGLDACCTGPHCKPTPQALSYASRRVRVVVWVAGFEPAASAFQARPSNRADITPRVEVAGRGRSMMFESYIKTRFGYKRTQCENTHDHRPAR